MRHMPKPSRYLTDLLVWLIANLHACLHIALLQLTVNHPFAVIFLVVALLHKPRRGFMVQKTLFSSPACSSIALMACASTSQLSSHLLGSICAQQLLSDWLTDLQMHKAVLFGLHHEIGRQQSAVTSAHTALQTIKTDKLSEHKVRACSWHLYPFGWTCSLECESQSCAALQCRAIGCLASQQHNCKLM